MTEKRQPARTGITLRHLRSFVALVDCESFTQAADRLFLTQSSLTTTIQQIESELGLRLFERTTRKVVPTAIAGQLKEHAERLLRDFDSFVVDAWAIAEGTQGHLRLAVAPSAMEWLVAPAIRHFRSAYPQMTISIRDSGFADVVKRVLDGDVDFGLTAVEIRNPELDYVPLYRDRLGVVCSGDHALASHKGTLKWSLLRQHQDSMIGLAEDTHLGHAYQASMRRFGLVNSSEEVSSSRSLYSMLSLGGRFALVPALTAHTHQMGSLPFVPLSEPEIYRENCLITRRLRALSPGAVNLMDSLREVLLKQHLPLHVELVA